MNDPLIRVEALTRTFGRGGRSVDAVRGVSLEIRAGETLGLVGESGSGKSTVGRLLLRLDDPTSGRVSYRGEDIADFGTEKLRAYRRCAQIVFQDPYGSLNPRLSAGRAIEEVLCVHGADRGPAVRARTMELLEMVGLSGDDADKYPHEFSGGQRQRVGIARALAVGPEFIVADEPCSALDVSVQAQILNLFKDLQAELGLTYLFISHDLSVVRQVADRVAVMRQGRIVELVDSDALFSAPAETYTQSLIDATPRLPRPGHASIEAPVAARPPLT